MRWIALGLALAVQLACVAAAQACTGQTGAVIFQDNFADDSGGWDFTPPIAQVTPPAFVFSVGKEYTSTSSENLTFNASLGDYCMDFVLPKSPAVDNTAAAGMIIWAKDYANYILVVTYSNGSIGMYKNTAGSFAVLFTVQNFPGFNAAQDAVNSLRIVATADQKLTVTLNGQAVKVIRAQMPTGPLLFGMTAQVDKSLPADITVKVTGFSVTAGS